MNLVGIIILILFIIFIASVAINAILLAKGTERRRFFFETNLLSKFMVGSFILLSIILVVLGHYHH